MLTSPAPLRVERDDRPAYRPFPVTVARVTELSPHFVRVTLTDPGLATFGRDGLDQRIKIFFPLPDGSISDLGEDTSETRPAGDWYGRWRALPPERQSPFRTYTVRAIRPDERELDVDFVRHPADETPADAPAARWLTTAAPGNRLTVAGPDARSLHSRTGIDWKPGNARQLLLVGDETAAPAILSILESLPPGREAHAMIEVPHEADAAALATDYRPGITVSWLARAGQENPAGDIPPHGDLLDAAVTRWLDAHPELIAEAAAPRRQRLDDINVDIETLWDSPAPAGGNFYAWIAGESAVVKKLRRQLVTERGVDRGRVAFMGYWRRGQAEKQG
ncbi:hypothetical protein GCM10022198_24890 [Klugiella xanthotipulae]|uniref:NADPH-dependent ferric siderophore reductase n=1 Tax=Klugiella xanthotipulae TaxID=244735 RepID=A0A543HZ79_9MICO|nr:siderophore-interacting protein [Klugiella xanthotipulae]TQM63618.1 NADPH-dependent ferric siderophore reductase [Klugiella xanthotipulae]